MQEEHRKTTPNKPSKIEYTDGRTRFKITKRQTLLSGKKDRNWGEP